MAAPLRHDLETLGPGSDRSDAPTAEAPSARPTTDPQDARHLPALDGVRGLAIALVLLYHVTPVRWASGGWVGVDLFFVLSGFLITGILWDGRHRPARARRFFVKRALRILPLYYGLLILIFVVVPAMDPLHKTAYQALKSDEWWYWTYLQNWRIAFAHPNDGGSFGWFWSLAIEEQFYVVWPFVVWHASRDTIIRLCGAAIFSGLVIRVALLVLHAPGSDSILFIYVLTPCRLDGLAVGALVAMAIAAPADASRLLIASACPPSSVCSSLQRSRSFWGFREPSRRFEAQSLRRSATLPWRWRSAASWSPRSARCGASSAHGRCNG